MNTEIEKQEKILQVIQKEQNLIDAFIPMKEKLYLFAPQDIQVWNDEKKEAFLRKTMMIIAHDDKIKECFDTKEGKLSIMDAVQKSCSTGLEIGGKHAYLIPQKISGKMTARYSIRASGYIAILCGGSRPIFKDLRWGKAYEQDDCKIDSGSGEVEHSISIQKDRGELIGIWVQIIKKNNQKEAIFFNMKKINQWKAKSKSQEMAWGAWPDEMAEQACIRHACDKYEQARDLLIAAIYDDEEIINEKKTTTEEISQELNKNNETIIIDELDDDENNDRF